MLSKNGVRPPSKMHGLGPKIHLKSPLAPQPVPLKIDSMPPSKGPFSANIHPIIPKLYVPIPQGMCFRKMVGGSFENERLGSKNPLQITIGTPAGFLQTRLKLTFQRSFLHEYASDPFLHEYASSRGHFSTNMHLIIPNFAVRIAQGMCFRKRLGFYIRKCTGIG